jgi:CRISPR-associated endonuclease/helicase Cas3
MLNAILPHLTGVAEQCASKLRKLGARIESYGERAWIIFPRKKRGLRNIGCGCPAGPVTLEDHSAHAVAWAKAFSKLCHLSKPLSQDMTLALEFHDEGKRDPREQAYFYGDTPNGKVLAKSGPRTRRADRKALRYSGWPKHGRHEVVGMTMLQHATDQWQDRAHDPDLVLYLISTHHGYCRPFAPLVIDPTTTNGLHATRADAGVADRFWVLVRRYGWYGLAYLEALARLADWGASREEEG